MTATALSHEEMAHELSWDVDFDLVESARQVPGKPIETGVREIWFPVSDKVGNVRAGFLAEGEPGQYIGVVEMVGDATWDTLDGAAPMDDDCATDALARLVIARFLVRGAQA